MLSFQVAAIERLVEELKAQGCPFQALPEGASFAGTPGTKHGEIIEFGPVKSAFLLDSEGNLLASNEIVG
jgi:hypothetical protein